MTFVWVLALIGSILGGLTLLSIAVQTGAPQQAAVAAIAVALAVIPYCFARAIEGIRGDGSASTKSRTTTPVDDTVTCRSCGKSIRPRPNETTCYLCGGALAGRQ